MGIELARAFVRVRADSAGLPQDLQGIRSAVASELTAIAGVATSLLGAFSAATGGFLRSGLQQAGQFEQTTIAFETMLGSVEETRKTLDDLTEFAAKTPFEMPGILQAARGLIQFGERGDQLMETLNLLGNASSGTSTDFGFLALVFNQIRGVGKLLTQDFRQLSTRGVLSLQDIADHFDVTTAEAQKMLSTGKIGFEDVRDILRGLSSEGGRFFNLMERQSQSLLGLISTLKDAWNIMSRILATAVVPAAKAVVSAFVEVLDKMSLFVQENGDIIGSALAGATAIGALTTAVLGLSVAFKVLGVSITTALIGTGVGVAVLALGAGVGVLIALLSRSSTIMGALSNLAEKLATSFVFLKETALIAIRPIVFIINNALGTAFLSLGHILDTIANKIGDFAIFVSSTILTIAQNWKMFLGLFAVESQIAFLKLQAGVRTGVRVFMDFFDLVIDLAKRFGSSMSRIFGIIWEGIKSGFTGGNVFEAIANEFKSELNAMIVDSALMASRITDVFEEEMDKLGPQFEALKTARQLLRDRIRFDDPRQRDDLDSEAEKTGKKIGEEAAAVLSRRSGFRDFGKGIQDALLANKDALGERRNKLLEEGNKKSDEMVQLLKNQKPLALV